MSTAPNVPEPKPGSGDPSVARAVTPAPSLALIFVALTPFAFGYLFSYLYRAANAVVAADLVRDLGLAPSELGLLTASYLVAFALFQLPLGVLLDRYGPRRVQAALVALGAAGALLFALGRDAITLTIARGIIGIAFSGGLMSSFKAVVIWVSEPRRALANALIMSLGGLGVLIASTPLELMVRAWGWRSVFMGLAAATLLAGLMILLMVPERNAATSSEPLGKQIRQIGGIYRDRVFWALAPLMATVSGTHVAIQTLWIAPWLRDVVGLDSLGVANALLVAAAAFVISILGAGVITDLLVRRGCSLLAVMAGFMLIFLASQVGLLFNPSDWWIAIVLWCVFAMTGHVAVIGYPWLSRYFGAALSGRSNTAANLLMFLWAFIVQYGVGAVIGLFPAPAGGRYASEAYQWAFGAFLVVQLLALAWFLANRRRLAQAGT